MTQVDRRAVVDLLGVLAYAELTAFDRLAEDARLAPSLNGRAALSKMAAAEIAHHVRLTDRLTELGVDPANAMAPFVSALDTFHESTRPSTWLEGLVKAYVGDGLATDFYREIASFLPDPDRALVLDVLADTASGPGIGESGPGGSPRRGRRSAFVSAQIHAQANLTARRFPS